MLARLAFATVLLSLPTVTQAQSAAPSAPICDGSELRRAEHTRAIGNALVAATAVADLAAVLTIPNNPGGAEVAGSHFRFVALASPILVAGLVVSKSAAPGETFWQRVIARMKVGETRAADVRLCLHRPNVASSNSKEERWTYITSRPSAFGGTLRIVRLTFRDSVLADVERTEVQKSAVARRADSSATAQIPRRRGFCMPPIPVIADPFPTPMDTSAAGAARARAQADADAASTNAQLQAAYAMCLASDSAR